MTQTLTNTRTAKDGTTITPAGRYEVHVRDLSEHLPLFRVEVLHSGSNHLAGDDHRSFATRDTAEHYAANLVQCLTVEHTGISDVQLEQVTAGVNTTMDRTEGEYAAKVTAERNIAAEIMADSRGFRGDRKPTTLAETAPAPTGRKVRNTRTHVFRQDLSPAQRNAITKHVDGVIRVGQGVTRPMLAALADKGYGSLNFTPGMGARKVIASLTLHTAEVTV